jgi:hypothetical protein
MKCMHDLDDPVGEVEQWKKRGLQLQMCCLLVLDCVTSTRSGYASLSRVYL